MLVLSMLKLRQEDCELKAGLAWTIHPHLVSTKKENWALAHICNYSTWGSVAEDCQRSEASLVLRVTSGSLSETVRPSQSKY